MTLFQLLMLGDSAYFAYKVYEHIQTLEDPKEDEQYNTAQTQRTADAFSTFSAEDLIEKADDAYANDDKEKALAFLYEANEKDENNEEILFKIAYILQQSGDSDEALKYYKDALTLDKRNEIIHNAIASLYRSKGEFNSALTHLKASLSIDDENPVTYYNFGNLHVDMDNIEEAKEMYQKALELDPAFSQAKEELEKLDTPKIGMSGENSRDI